VAHGGHRDARQLVAKSAKISNSQQNDDDDDDDDDIYITTTL
jgi:hypothetical protein